MALCVRSCTNISTIYAVKVSEAGVRGERRAREKGRERKSELDEKRKSERGRVLRRLHCIRYKLLREVGLRRNDW